MNQAALDALSKTKIKLMARPDSVFFTTVCFSLKHYFDEKTPTACTNGKDVRYGVDFFMAQDPDERLGLMLHETLHCAYMHMLRFEGLPNGDHERWNIAADHVINLQLIDRGFKLPQGALADPAYTGMAVEEVYKRLSQDPLGSGGGGIGMDLEAPADGTEATQLAEDIKDILVRASLQSKMAGDKPGTIPGDIEIFLEKLLNPKLPWHLLLRRYLQTFNKNDYSMQRPNRRYLPKFYLPSLYSESLLDIAIAVDASGSVSDADFLRFVSETHAIIKSMKPSNISLLTFDTGIRSVNKVRSVQELMQVKFTGRGGTAISPVLEWANQNKPQLLLVFTDGEFRFYDLATKTPVLWLIHNNPSFKAPFGKTIHYEM